MPTEKGSIEQYEVKVHNAAEGNPVTVLIEHDKGFAAACEAACEAVTKLLGSTMYVRAAKEHAGRVCVIRDGQKPVLFGVNRGPKDLPGQTVLDNEHDRATGAKK